MKEIIIQKIGARVSGLYRGQGFPGIINDLPGDASLAKFKEEIRLDVDGSSPQMMASGVIRSGLRHKVQWIARLEPEEFNRWKGTIWNMTGDQDYMPWRSINMTVNNVTEDRDRCLTVQYLGHGIPSRTRDYNLTQKHFNRLDVVVDSTGNINPVTVLDLENFNNQSEILASNFQSISTVMERAGLRSRLTINRDAQLEGPDDGTWSTVEIVDAFRTWATQQKNENTPRAWVLNIGRHEEGPEISSLVMNNIGGRKLSGISVMYDSFLTKPTVGKTEFIDSSNRRLFMSTIHGLGDALGLGHSWQKRGLGIDGIPGIPLENEREARSFMNDPIRVAGGENLFFSDFNFNFSDTELMIMRHGTAFPGPVHSLEWYQRNGNIDVSHDTSENLDLQFRLNRQQSVVQFMEPVIMEMKLTNRGQTPILIDNDILENQNQMTIIINRNGTMVRQMKPMFHMHRQFQKQVLMPGEVIFNEMMISVGQDGWLIDEAGLYTIEGVLHLDDGDLVATPLIMRVEPARSYEEEVFAQDFLTVEMASLISAGGSLLLSNCNNILKEITDKFSNRQVAKHAHRLLGLTMVRDYKLLLVDKKPADNKTISQIGGHLEVVAADMNNGLEHLLLAAENDNDRAVNTFGHIGYVKLVNQICDLLIEQDRVNVALNLQKNLKDTMVNRKIKTTVIDEITTNISRIKARTSKKEKKAKN